MLPFGQLQPAAALPHAYRPRESLSLLCCCCDTNDFQMMLSSCWRLRHHSRDHHKPPGSRDDSRLWPSELHVVAKHGLKRMQSDCQ